MNKINTKRIIFFSSLLAIFIISSITNGLPVAMAGSVAASGPMVQELRWIFAYKKPVRLGKLMTKRERRAYRRAMRAAKTYAARKQIRELTYARLGLRARERGMLVVIPVKGTAQAHQANEVVPLQKAESVVIATTAQEPQVQQLQKETLPSAPTASTVSKAQTAAPIQPVQQEPPAPKFEVPAPSVPQVHAPVREPAPMILHQPIVHSAPPAAHQPPRL